jgi:DNA-binding NarL/FixJ family response regulator
MGVMFPLRLLLADQSSEFLDATQVFLSGHSALQVVARAGSAPECYALAAAHGVDLVMFDFVLPGPNTLQLARQLRALPSAPRVIITCAFEGPDYRSAAIYIGACGYLPKPALATELLPLLARLFPGRGDFGRPASHRVA